jgi:hypothetical protein
MPTVLLCCLRFLWRVDVVGGAKVKLQTPLFLRPLQPNAHGCSPIQSGHIEKDSFTRHAVETRSSDELVVAPVVTHR